MRAMGVDIGTTTVSGVVIDGQTGRALMRLTWPGEAWLPGEKHERLQDAGRVCERALAMAAQLFEACAPVDAVGLTGQMHGVVYIDALGRAVSPLYTWQDGRAGLISRGGQSYSQALSAACGYAVPEGYGLATHYYNQAHGLVPGEAAYMVTIADYAAMRMTGQTLPVLSASNAASLGAFCLESGDFDRAALARAGLDTRLLGEVSARPRVLGTTARGGLPGGVPVAVAIGDNQASFIGSVRDAQDSALVNVGTGSQVSLLAARPVSCPDCETRPLDEGAFLLVSSSLCGGRAYALLEKLAREIAVAAGAPDRPLYDLLERFALKGLEADDPIRVSPLFCGKRSNPALRASVTGIGERNFTAAHLAAGMLRGIVEELYQPYLNMCALSGRRARQLVGSGNAVRKNAALRRAFESAFEMKLRVPACEEEAACGAALNALAACGLRDSLSSAQSVIRYADEDGQ